VIVGIHLPAELQLLQVAVALNRLGRALGLVQGGQQQRGQDGNDRDDDQQLNEREGARAAMHSVEP